jgi:hypothetical protein
VPALISFVEDIAVVGMSVLIFEPAILVVTMAVLEV